MRRSLADAIYVLDAILGCGRSLADAIYVLEAVLGCGRPLGSLCQNLTHWSNGKVIQPNIEIINGSC